MFDMLPLFHKSCCVKLECNITRKLFFRSYQVGLDERLWKGGIRPYISVYTGNMFILNMLMAYYRNTVLLIGLLERGHVKSIIF